MPVTRSQAELAVAAAWQVRAHLPDALRPAIEVSPVSYTHLIFAPFEQVSDALLDRRAGAGLGLWISRSHAEALGGRMRVESELGRGSTFTVELPLVVARLSHPLSTAAERADLLAVVSGELAATSRCV